MFPTCPIFIQVGSAASGRKRILVMAERQKGLFLILPAVIIMAVFTVYPLLNSLWMAFTDNNLLGSSVEFVGLDNFARLLSDDVFWLSLYHSIVLTVVVVLLQFGLGLILAWGWA